MSDFDSDELAALAEQGRPQPGDDEQLVIMRTLLRSMVRLARASATHKATIATLSAEVAEATVLAKKAQVACEIMSPSDKPDDHIVTRVLRLERASNGISTILKSNSGAILLALLYGGYQLMLRGMK